MADPTREQDKLAGSQSLIKRSDTGNDKAFTSPKAPTPSLILPTKDFFTKFMKVFIESTQAWNRKQAKPWKQLLKARFPKIYSKKSHIDGYHFCQQCGDHFKTSNATEINRTPFAALFLRETISFRWAQHKCRYQSAILITWSKFKTFLWKNLENSQAFIDNI